MTKYIRDLYLYRSFIYGCVKREFQAKYAKSLLGSLWNIINPLSMIIVYTVIFSNIMRSRLPDIDSTFAYSIFLCSGIFTWGLFSEITTKSQSMFIDNANMLKKLIFPRICIPATIVLSSILNFAIVFSLFISFLLITNNFPGLVFISLIPLLIILILFASSLGLILGILNVFFRDIGQAFTVIITFWFWFTPIIYSSSILPNWSIPLTNVNPLKSIIVSIQNVLVLGQYPNWSSLLYVTILTIAFGSYGLKLFRKYSTEIVDEL